MQSELENVVLGMVWADQPCTAYTVRKVFQNSPSSHWSGSAGAIYPLMRRLEGRGLLCSTARRGDRRATKLYRLTQRGRRDLEAWLSPPLPPASALMNVDPLRIRVWFLKVLPEEQRLAVIDEALAKMHEQLERVREEARRSWALRNASKYLVDRGAVLSIRAQAAWLREVRRSLDSLR